MKKKTPAKAAGVGTEAVKKATGKTWDEWFAILDAAGGKQMTHQEIVAFLVKQHQVGPWWRQMVTVGYEQGSGKRAKHEKPDGFQIGRSKTLSVPVGRAYRAWIDDKIRRRWLGDEQLVIRKATRDKSIRITWSDAKTTVEAMFYPKGPAKVQVTVQHNKLPSAAAGERMKKFWSVALGRLEELLDG